MGIVGFLAEIRRVYAPNIGQNLYHFVKFLSVKAKGSL